MSWTKMRLWSLGLLLCACSPASAVCTPGASVPCACPGGSTGAQVCTSDGAGFGVCQCALPVDAAVPADAGRAEDAAAPPDAAPPAACGARALAFSLRLIDQPRPTGGGTVAPGFNLDAVDSSGVGTTCVELNPDYRSPTGERGVDNGLASLVDALDALSGEPVSTSFRRAQADGDWDLAVVIDELDSLPDDPSVVVSLYRFTRGTGYQLVGSTRTAVAGAAFRVTFPGAVAFAPSGSPVIGMLHDTTLGAELSCAGLTAVTLGGSFDIEEMAIAAELVMPGLGETVRGVLGGIADMAPIPFDPTTCERASVAYTFGATVPVTPVPR